MTDRPDDDDDDDCRLARDPDRPTIRRSKVRRLPPLSERGEARLIPARRCRTARAAPPMARCRPTANAYVPAAYAPRTAARLRAAALCRRYARAYAAAASGYAPLRVRAASGYAPPPGATLRPAGRAYAPVRTDAGPTCRARRRRSERRPVLAPGQSPRHRCRTAAGRSAGSRQAEAACPAIPAAGRAIIKTKQPAGTIVIDTPSTFLYFVNGDGTAIRYGIGVGRDGFTWAGTEKVTRMAEWPDWHPPSEMIERQPYLPRFMAGGESNPMGARALYLGKTIYRVHGTNQPSTIGNFRVVRLHPHAQRGRRGPLYAREGRHQGRRAAATAKARRRAATAVAVTHPHRAIRCGRRASPGGFLLFPACARTNSPHDGLARIRKIRGLIGDASPATRGIRCT